MSPRQTEIVLALMSGVPRKAIGEVIGCAPETVRTHLRRIYLKLGVKSGLQLGLRIVEIWRADMLSAAETDPEVSP